MSLVLNTNLSSMVAQNSLTASGGQLATALQQLSSGLRINTAADDAAGYAIVQGMTSQINGINQAAQNANDGVSLAQTASGALQEVVNDLQTMRDLAVQSLNATNSSTDRADLDAQFQQLKSDINSVASQTQFNGVNLLDGTFQGATFQVGANAGQTINVSSIGSAAASNLGQLNTLVSAGVGTYGGGNSDTVSFSVSVTPAGGVASAAIQTSTITLTGTQSTDLKSIAGAINQAVGSQGIVATVDANGGIDLSSTAIGQTVTIATTATQGAGVGNVGGETAATFGLTEGANVIAASATPGTINSANVTTVDNSNQVLVQVDQALQQLATESAQLGAYQNRFQSAITGLNTDSTNLTSARSQIQDTDYASATSALSKAQILQQAGTAMVAQANTIPQNILTLLQKLP
ncbi:MAG TPA: flagellin [Steroidobacteraceae bacterium]|jgi:flagellin|nr:flagellin [Steroidobacteraceae bacterium]